MREPTEKMDTPAPKPEQPGDNAPAPPPAPVVVAPVSVPQTLSQPHPHPHPGTLSLIARYPWHVHVPIFLVAAIVTLAFGLSMPVMKVEKAYFWEKDYTLITGAQGLWEKGEYFLASILLAFSGVVPVIKLLLLGALLILPMRPRARARLVDIVDAVGRWSMLDVFVVALFIVLAKSTFIATAEPATGLYLFCAAIVLSMLLSLEMRRLSKRALTP